MMRGELNDAVRRALNILEAWVDATGVIQKHSGYYYEIQSVVEDAVHCGAQAVTKDYRPLESERKG